jgi:hypothetical protein
MHMVKTKQLIPNPDYNPALPKDWNNQPFRWQFSDAGRNIQQGDVVEFLCNGRGRGGHVRVFARVVKVNRKTFKAIELPRSYSPGTNWTVNFGACFEPGAGGITIDFSWKD